MYQHMFKLQVVENNGFANIKTNVFSVRTDKPLLEND